MFTCSLVVPVCLNQWNLSEHIVFMFMLINTCGTLGPPPLHSYWCIHLVPHLPLVHSYHPFTLIGAVIIVLLLSLVHSSRPYTLIGAFVLSHHSYWCIRLIPSLSLVPSHTRCTWLDKRKKTTISRRHLIIRVSTGWYRGGKKAKFKKLTNRFRCHGDLAVGKHHHGLQKFWSHL